MEFGTKLKELRATKGVSQAKLAADIHISRSAVAKWENGLGLPNDESLRMLSEYFGIPVSDLIPDKTNAETIVSKNKTIIDISQDLLLPLVLSCSYVRSFILTPLLPIHPRHIHAPCTTCLPHIEKTNIPPSNRNCSEGCFFVIFSHPF